MRTRDTIVVGVPKAATTWNSPLILFIWLISVCGLITGKDGA